MNKLSLVLLIVLLVYTLSSCENENEEVTIDYYSNPQYANDSDLILLSFKVDGRYRMATYNVKTHSTKWLKSPLAESASLITPVFSNDFSKIAFTWMDIEKGIMRVCLIDANGDNFKLVGRNDFNSSHPVFSNDSKTIYFSGKSRSKGKQLSWIYSYDLETGITKKVSEKGFPALGFFTVSKDNKYLIFSQLYGSKKTKELENRLVKLDLSSGKTVFILEDKSIIMPVALRKSDKIIFLGTNLSSGEMHRLPISEPERYEKEVKPNIFSGFFSINIDGTNRVLLNKHSAGAYTMTISNDDKKILFFFIGELKEYDLETGSIKIIKLDKRAIFSSYQEDRKY